MNIVQKASKQKSTLRSEAPGVVEQSASEPKNIPRTVDTGLLFLVLREFDRSENRKFDPVESKTIEDLSKGLGIAANEVSSLLEMMEDNMGFIKSKDKGLHVRTTLGKEFFTNTYKEPDIRKSAAVRALETLIDKADAETTETVLDYAIIEVTQPRALKYLRLTT